MVLNNRALRQKTQSFDLDELLANTPPWPPVKSPCQNNKDEEKEMGSSEWVDKVMVNKQDINKVNSPLRCWDTDSGNLPDEFYQKYLPDSSKIYPEQSYNLFMGNNQFNIASVDDLDDLDAATSDSSEPDLLWQFNQSKLTSIVNGIGQKTKKPTSKSTKALDLRNVNSVQGPSQSRKQINGAAVGPRGGRQRLIAADTKCKAGNRK